jgi:hypothetical protein
MDCHTDHDPAMMNGAGDGGPVELGDPGQQRIFPFARLAAEHKTCQDRSDSHRECHRAQESEGHGPGHRAEQPAFHALERKNRQVGRNDDGDGVEDRSLHFVRCVADAVLHGFRDCFLMAQMTDDVFDHHHGAIHDHPEIESS